MSFTPGAGTRFLLFGSQPLSGGTISGNSSASFLDISGTWNTTGTPTGIRLNVTDTASNAASLLMDLQVGGASRFRVQKSGAISGNSTGMGGVGAGAWFGSNGENFHLDRGTNRSPSYSFFTAGGAYQVRFNDATAFGWTSGTSDASLDLSLFRDAANTLAQRNGVNAQTLRVYNTFTDASNYERGRLAWVSNVLTIGTENAGTGLARNLTIESAGGQLSFSSSSSIQLQVNGRAFISHAAGASTLNFGGVTAGPANIDTIAIFTNNLQRWTFNNSGHFVAFADNTYDIGSTGANRPRNVFWAGYQEMSEMTAPAAPAANSVRIYAEDNGSGKTRLMARFATGAAQQIAIEP